MSSPAPPHSSVQSAPSSSSGLQPDSLHTARLQIIHFWFRKTLPVAIAVGILPCFGLGLLNFGVSHQVLKQSESQTSSKAQPQSTDWLLWLLMGSGAIAVLTGGLAWLWLRVFIHALVKQSTQFVAQADQFQVSESIEDLGCTIGILQEQKSIRDVLDTAAYEVRTLLQCDRVLVFCDDDANRERNAESLTAGHSTLLNADLSHLPISLKDLFKVPIGYVQVCSEVSGSDLPEQHQDILTNLGVQAQMVTRLTLDKQSKGLLVVQSSTPRDWTEVEHQLFAAIAKQIAIALDRKASPEQPNPSAKPTYLNNLWTNYHDHCCQLAESSEAQERRIRHAVEQIQDGLDNSQLLAQGLKQVQEHIQTHTQMLRTSETSVNRSMTSITQMQETLAQSSQSSEQLIDLGQKVTEAAAKVKELANRVNYQAMNASISAKKQESHQVWSIDFTNEVLQLTRDLSQQTTDIEALSTQLLSESRALAAAADLGNEQVLVSSEWFRDSRQQWNQMVTINGKLEGSLNRLIENHQEREKFATQSHQEIMEVAHWLTQTAEESDAMVQAMTQANARALA